MVTTKSSARYTPTALASFFRHTTLSREDRLLLIDNDSSFSLPTDGYAPHLIMVTNPSPKGFAANMNRGIGEALSRKTGVVLLNNDLVFSRGWFDEIARVEDGISSPLSTREVTYTLGDFSATNPMELDAYLGHEEAFDRIAEEHRRRNTAHLAMLVLPFFAAYLPFSVISRVGRLDEEFGRGGAEDYDYCLRAHTLGIPVRFVSSSFVLHFGGKSSWSGAESREEQTKREEVFFSRFQAKWGERLTDICLKEKISIVEDDASLRELQQAGRYGDLVARLKP